MKEIMNQKELDFVMTKTLPNYMVYSKKDGNALCQVCNELVDSSALKIKKAGAKVKCPNCNADVTIRHNKTFVWNEDKALAIIPDKHYGKLMLRYYLVYRKYKNDFRTFSVEYKECFREYFQNGTFWAEDRTWDGQEWKECNLPYGDYRHTFWTNRDIGTHINICREYVSVYLDDINRIKKGTFLERIDVKDVLKEVKFNRYSVFTFFDDCNRGFEKLFEYLQKVGMKSLARNLAVYGCGLEFNKNGVSLADILCIKKWQYRELLKLGSKVTPADVKRYQERNECEKKYNLKNESEIDIFMKWFGTRSWEVNINKFMKSFKFSWHKFDLYASNQENFKVNDYIDYLAMCNELGMDMRNTFVAFPKDPKKAHDMTTVMYNEMQFDSKLMRYAENANNFASEYKKVFKKNKDKYLYDLNNMEIVFPETTRDIGVEGYKLRHCVAQYMEDICKNKKIVLFIRRKDEIDTPFYTIEIIGKEITQCKGYNNRPRETEVQNFLESFAKAKKLSISKDEYFAAVM